LATTIPEVVRGTKTISWTSYEVELNLVQGRENYFQKPMAHLY
jgi:hypothetical protein